MFVGLMFRNWLSCRFCLSNVRELDMIDVLLIWLCSYLLYSSLLIVGLWVVECVGWLGCLFIFM